jgi:hypothetical protein
VWKCRLNLLSLHFDTLIPHKLAFLTLRGHASCTHKLGGVHRHNFFTQNHKNIPFLPEKGTFGDLAGVALSRGQDIPGH